MRMFALAAASAAALFAANAAVAQDREGWPSSLTIGTASQGGTYFIYGNGLASFISENLGINASGEVTGGPVQNVTLVQTGDHEIGLVTMGPAYERARAGRGASRHPRLVPDVPDAVPGGRAARVRH
jgi:TRAP-type uncharacterized transport system substrate-binding protein